MPRFYQEHARGYDLNMEVPFIEVDGQRVKMGSAGSIIMACETCGEEHFREQISPNECCFQGHGQMKPLTFALADKLRPVLEAQGVTFTTVEQRRSDRLEREKARPWDWVFGDKTEADFPLGYVKSAATTQS